MRGKVKTCLLCVTLSNSLQWPYFQAAETQQAAPVNAEIFRASRFIIVKKFWLNVIKPISLWLLSQRGFLSNFRLQGGPSTISLRHPGFRELLALWYLCFCPCRVWVTVQNAGKVQRDFTMTFPLLWGMCRLMCVHVCVYLCVYVACIVPVTPDSSNSICRKYQACKRYYLIKPRKFKLYNKNGVHLWFFFKKVSFYIFF